MTGIVDSKRHESSMSSTSKRSHVEEEQKRRTWRSFALFVWAFVAVGAALVAWSLATPLMAAPDEPAQVVQAAAIVRGQFDEPVTVHAATGELAVVNVPQWASAGLSEPGCYAFNSKVAASCAPKLSSKTETVQATTQFSNYPPLYYFMVGLPTLALAGSQAVYAMRILGDIVNAGLIALGLFLLIRYHPRRLTNVGAMIALSPMVFFVLAVVNSSGLEIAAAFATWSGGLCVVEWRPVPKPLAIWTTISLVLLILSRPISPVNAAVIIVVLMVLVGWRRVRDSLRDRTILLMSSLTLASIIAVGVLLLVVGAPHLLGYPEKPALSLADSIWLTLRQTGTRLGECIGKFGWLDTPVPLFVTVVWGAACGAVIAVGLALSSRCRRALPLLAVLILLIPIVFESPRIDSVGLFWQGRYWLPVVIGLPLVASALHGAHRSSWLTSPLRSVAVLVGLACGGALLIVAQVVAFLTALHRYETGLGAPSGTPIRWSPPGGESAVVILFIAGQVLLLGFLLVDPWGRFRANGPGLPANKVAEEI
jgi:hypothetical protein